MDFLAELHKLHELHQAGALTDEEFAKAKAAVLSGQPMPKKSPLPVPPSRQARCEICEKALSDGETRRWTQRQPRRTFQICPQCHANVEPDAPENANTPCRECGRRPAVYIRLVAGIGRLVYRQEEHYDGWFCKQCGLALYDQVMNRHLANTWWSPTSLIFGATIGTAMNLVAKNKLMALEEEPDEAKAASLVTRPSKPAALPSAEPTEPSPRRKQAAAEPRSSGGRKPSWAPVLVGLLIGVPFVALLCLADRSSQVAVTTTAKRVATETSRPDNTGQLEKMATERLELLRSSTVEAWSKRELVGPLARGGYGKRYFNVVDSKCNMVPNRESSAYPFKGVIELRYGRWATISHKSKVDAEADEKFYFANYDQAEIAWCESAEAAEHWAKEYWVKPHKTSVFTLLFDKIESKWIKKSEEIK